MINKRMMKSAVIITVAMLSLGGCAGGCSKQEQPVSAEPTQEIEESTEESLEETPSPTVTPTTEPAEESSSREESLDSSENEVDTAEEDLGYEIINIDDTIMYATQNCNLRQGPGTDYEKNGSLSYAQEITVNGKVETEDGKVWWVLKSDTEEKQMVSGGLVSETKPVQQTTQPSTGGGSTTQPSGGNDGGGQPSGGGGGSQPATDNGMDGDWGANSLPEIGAGGLQDSGHHWNVE